MRFNWALGVCFGGLFLSSIGSAQQRHLMLVVSKGLPGVVLYNADTDEVVCRSAKMAPSPHEVAFTPNGRTMIVPVYGNTLLGTPGSNEHVVYFLNSRTCEAIGEVDTGLNLRPHGIAVTKSGKVYLTTELSETVTAIDGTNRAVTGAIPTGSKYSHMLVVTPDEKTAFVSNVMSKTISVLDLGKGRLEKTLEVGAENQRIDLSPDAKQFVTSFWRENKIAFFKVAERELDFTVPTDGSALQAKYSADGKFVYALGTGGQRQIGIWKIDVAKREVVARVLEGIGVSMAAFSISPFNGNLYVSDQVGNEVVVVDSNDLKVVKRIPADKSPDGIAFASSR
jgi:YVTN family beta-propeller protein